MNPDAIEALREAVGCLEALGIDYMVGGSVASIVYGHARTTRDIDMVLRVTGADAKRLSDALTPRFYADPVAIGRAIDKGDCFNAIHLNAVFQVDVFTPKASPWLEAQFGRRILRDMPFTTPPIFVYFAGPEDTILNKLIWYRLGNEASEVQWRDAIGVLQVQGKALDRDYLAYWAEQNRVSDLLERAFLEVE